VLADRSAKSRTAVLAVDGWVGLRESFEDAFRVLGRYTDASVADFEPEFYCMVGVFHRSGAHANETLPRELERVGGQID
jgi:hypothetical protein